MTNLRVGDRVRTIDIPFEEGIVVQIIPISCDRSKIIVLLDGERLFYGYDDDFEIIDSGIIEVFIDEV